MYFDSCYIAKFYLNEPDSGSVRKLVWSAGCIYSSLWALAEFHGAVHRRMREGLSSPREARNHSSGFSEHLEAGMWRLIPVTESLLRRTSALMIAAPPALFLRTADAVHLVTAKEAGEREIWTGDRHMLKAASYFGLKGRSI